MSYVHVRICRELTQLAATVLSLATPASEDPGLPPARRRYFERIVRQANLLTDLLEDFLRQVQPDGVRQDAGQSGTVQAANVGADVVDAVNEAVGIAGLTWQGRATVQSQPGQARCQLPPVLLHRVISNLLSNATRAAGPSGTVTIQIGRQEGATTVSVRDSGPGLGAIPTGSGIGLAVAARIIAKYDGRIEFGSDTGGGACVSLWLP
jgi:signal transduction histidine kinase